MRKIYDQEESFLDGQIAVIILNENKEQVLGFVDNDLALLIEVPNPKTGYHFKDIIHVSGPIGNQLFRDDFLKEYNAIKVNEKSKISTFTFTLKTNTKEGFVAQDLFKIKHVFKSYRQDVQFLNFFTQQNRNQMYGWCSAESFSQAEELLKLATKEIKEVTNKIDFNANQ